MARRAPRCSKNIAKRGAVAKKRMTGDKQSFIETLKNNRSFCSIVNAVALSERCSFFLLSSKTQLSTNAALEYLKTSVEGLTGESIELVLYRPKYGSGYKEMIEDTIRPLLDRDMGSFGHTLYALDFTSFADTPNETVVVFQRLNELRNAIVERLDGSLVVIAPFGMEREFALRAPDMWSVRCGVCMMEAALVESVDMPTFAESPKAQTTLGYAKNDVTELSEEVARLRELYRGSPDNYAIGRGLLVALHRYGKYIMEYGSLDDVLMIYEEAYKIAKQIHAANPASLEAARNLLVCYEKKGDIYLKMGDIQKAKTAYEESLEIRKQIHAANPASLEAARDLSVSCAKLAQVYESAGDDQAALRYWSDCKALLEPLARRVGDVDDIASMLDDCKASIERLI